MIAEYFRSICSGDGTYYTRTEQTPKGESCRWQWCPVVHAHVLANRRNGKVGRCALPLLCVWSDALDRMYSGRCRASRRSFAVFVGNQEAQHAEQRGDSHATHRS